MNSLQQAEFRLKIWAKHSVHSTLVGKVSCWQNVTTAAQNFNSGFTWKVSPQIAFMCRARELKLLVNSLKSSDLTMLVAHLYSPRFFICISLALVLTTPCLYWQRYNCWYRSVWSPWPRVSQTPQYISTWPKNLCFWWGACTDDCCSFCQGVCISV